MIDTLELTGGGQASFDNLTIITEDMIGQGDWDGDGTVEAGIGTGEDQEAGVVVLDSAFTANGFDSVTMMFVYEEEIVPPKDSGIFEDDPSGAARVSRAFLIEEAFLPDVQISVDIQGIDGDGDLTQVETIDFAIDGDGDGFFL